MYKHAADWMGKARQDPKNLTKEAFDTIYRHMYERYLNTDVRTDEERLENAASFIMELAWLGTCRQVTLGYDVPYAMFRYDVDTELSISKANAVRDSIEVGFFHWILNMGEEQELDSVEPAARYHKHQTSGRTAPLGVKLLNGGVSPRSRATIVAAECHFMHLAMFTLVSTSTLIGFSYNKRYGDHLEQYMDKIRLGVQLPDGTVESIRNVSIVEAFCLPAAPEQ